MDNEIIKEIDFYEQKVKEVKSKLYKYCRENEKEEIKIIDQVITDKWSMYQGDCIEVLKGIPSDSIHYSLFSPPFSSLFT